LVCVTSGSILCASFQIRKRIGCSNPHICPMSIGTLM
jgi:hypothetical protein